jgi:uncharacterized membrane protein YgcG
MCMCVCVCVCVWLVPVHGLPVPVAALRIELPEALRALRKQCADHFPRPSYHPHRQLQAHHPGLMGEQGPGRGLRPGGGEGGEGPGGGGKRGGRGSRREFGRCQAAGGRR